MALTRQTGQLTAHCRTLTCPGFQRALSRSCHLAQASPSRLDRRPRTCIHPNHQPKAPGQAVLAHLRGLWLVLELVTRLLLGVPSVHHDSSPGPPAPPNGWQQSPAPRAARRRDSDVNRSPSDLPTSSISLETRYHSPCASRMGPVTAREPIVAAESCPLTWVTCPARETGTTAPRCTRNTVAPRCWRPVAPPEANVHWAAHQRLPLVHSCSSAPLAPAGTTDQR